MSARDAVATVLKKHKRVLVEKFISGPELTVGLLEHLLNLASEAYGA